MSKRTWIIITSIIILIIIATTIYAINSNNNNTMEENQISQENVILNEIKEEKEFSIETTDETYINTSEKLKESKIIEELEISNIRIEEKNDKSQILANIENNNEQIKGGFEVVVEVLDKEGNIMVGLNGYIDEVKPGETGILNISATSDFANAYDFNISKK